MIRVIKVLRKIRDFFGEAGGVDVAMSGSE
jgi:hypothetical protein